MVQEEVTMLAWFGDVGSYVMRLRSCPVTFAFLPGKVHFPHLKEKSGIQTQGVSETSR